MEEQTGGANLDGDREDESEHVQDLRDRSNVGRLSLNPITTGASTKQAIPITTRLPTKQVIQLSVKSSATPDPILSSQSSSPKHNHPDDLTSDQAPGDRVLRSRDIAVIVPQVERRWEYRVYDEELIVDRVLRRSQRSGPTQFLVRLTSGQQLGITATDLLCLTGGSRALELFDSESSNTSEASNSFDSDTIRVTTPPQLKRKNLRPLARALSTDSSGDELGNSKSTRYLRDMARLKLSLPNPTHKSNKGVSTNSQTPADTESNSHEKPVGRRSTRSSKRGKSFQPLDYDDDSDDEVGERPPVRSSARVKHKQPNYVDDVFQDNFQERFDNERSDPRLRKRKHSDLVESDLQVTRKSTRGGRPEEMVEIDEDDIPDRDVAVVEARAIGTKEVFQSLLDSEFSRCHLLSCDTCGVSGDSPERGVLVCCQGCTTCYHQVCLGSRSRREHLVTKVGPNEFVLQCRRCVDSLRKKEGTAPSLGRCQVCHAQGPSCTPFRERKTPKEEEKLREDNGGEDPVIPISRDLINQADNVFFRCSICRRAFHFHHMPARSAEEFLTMGNDEEKWQKRFEEYTSDWKCKECLDTPEKLEKLISWRPLNKETYVEGQSFEEVDEDDKEYLVKWKDLSYNKATWQSGAWVFGIATAHTRNSFANDNERTLPKWRFEDAIPEEYLRVDIVFEVEYTCKVRYESLDIDKARITEVAKARVKFKGLRYEDVVWEEPPKPEDAERYADFKSAYDDWVLAKYLHPPKKFDASLKKARSQNFEADVMIKKQPTSLNGGVLRDHQLEGINWLLYQWWRGQNAILADEMGLGKTIQIVGLCTVLTSTYRCWPILIVVPNSTCANWRREIKQWAPILRVVMFFGSSIARELSENYEMFPKKSKDLRCHIVVTSYDAAQDPNCTRVFRKVQWAGLIVDEGQKLKNEQSQLYVALAKLNISFKVLLTGTPLQNNHRELFNLLQFLDPSMNAQSLEERFPDITKDNLSELHELIRPFILRRTKLEVLKDLPPMVSVIVPVTLSALQKELYKGILGRNAELLKSIFSGERTSKVAGLRNILMDLRKCLCHPFVYNIGIEEKDNSDAAASYRRLIEASSKLRLLEIMLPKLKERGHRVLIFSQFLDMLTVMEDLLDGLGLAHERIDGSMGSITKQKRIDKFNAPDSPLFACVLSTRAGGVGINLATADTVIILDPDFNPHQDIQAASRAHRMGQKNKVLVFQLMTRHSVEEKIMQRGKTKMALENVIIRQMGVEEQDSNDLESILRHGAEAIFKDEDSVNDIKYDSSSVDKLLDRTHAENMDSGMEKSVESQFSFARVWANEKGTIDNDIGNSEEETPPADPDMWDKIIADRRRQALEEEVRRAENSGRGKRQRKTVHYGEPGYLENDGNPDKVVDGRDSEFEAQAAESGGEDSFGDDVGGVDVEELQSASKKRRSYSSLISKESLLQTVPPANESRTLAVPKELPSQPKPKAFKRIVVKPAATSPAPDGTDQCVACEEFHPLGYCPLKHAGFEKCPTCGIAHTGDKGACPVLGKVGNVTQFTEDSKKRLSSQEQHMAMNNGNSTEKGPKKKMRKDGTRAGDPQRMEKRKAKAKEAAVRTSAPLEPDKRTTTPAPLGLEKKMRKDGTMAEDPKHKEKRLAKGAEQTTLASAGNGSTDSQRSRPAYVPPFGRPPMRTDNRVNGSIPGPFATAGIHSYPSASGHPAYPSFTPDYPPPYGSATGQPSESSAPYSSILDSSAATLGSTSVHPTYNSYSSIRDSAAATLGSASTQPPYVSNTTTNGSSAPALAPPSSISTRETYKSPYSDWKPHN